MILSLKFIEICFMAQNMVRLGNIKCTSEKNVYSSIVGWSQIGCLFCLNLIYIHGLIYIVKSWALSTSFLVFCCFDIKEPNCYCLLQPAKSMG